MPTAREMMGIGSEWLRAIFSAPSEQHLSAVTRLQAGTRGTLARQRSRELRASNYSQNYAASAASRDGSPSRTSSCYRGRGTSEVADGAGYARALARDAEARAAALPRSFSDEQPDAAAGPGIGEACTTVGVMLHDMLDVLGMSNCEPNGRRADGGGERPPPVRPGSSSALRSPGSGGALRGAGTPTRWRADSETPRRVSFAGRMIPATAPESAAAASINEDTSESFSSVSGGAGVLAGGGGGSGCREWRIDMSHIARR